MEHKPGRELDALIAEKVMGHVTSTKHQCSCNVYPCIKHGTFRKYSTDIAAAWEVAQKIRGFSRLYDFTVWCIGDDEWGAEFITNKTSQAWAETAPHAICLAAIKAVQCGTGD